MKSLVSRRPALVVAASLALIGVALTAAVAGANFTRSTPPSAPMIATIDLEAAFDGIHERRDLEAQLKSTLDQYQADLKKKADEVESLQTTYAALTGNAKQAKAKELREAVLRTEIEKQFSQKKLDEMRAEMRRDLYIKITDACKRNAKANGYSLVISNDEKATVPPLGDPDTVARAISLKRIIYTDPALDITSEVVTMMNNEYSKK